MNDFAQSIYTNLLHVPKGRVITYGQLAKLAGYPNHSRQVGKLLAKLPNDTKLAWYRVINSQGKISLTGERFFVQKEKLEEEGISIKDDGRIEHFKKVIMR
ncbi:MGMT family protein [Aliivibrio salmonicida]|jgi:methylated-DNA-protein-cysteine methyltransferase-like protein|uniref:MGMT family protein n=1 Tax=Aliivibrio salmonicida TaxID=40269 RepID=UPI003D0A4A42